MNNQLGHLGVEGDRQRESGLGPTQVGSGVRDSAMNERAKRPPLAIALVRSFFPFLSLFLSFLSSFLPTLISIWALDSLFQVELGRGPEGPSTRLKRRRWRR